MPSLDIAVVGCGPAGMAAALFLSRAGHRVRLFERFATPRPLGSGLLLQPTGLAVLRRLGLMPAITADGARIDRLHGVSFPSGRVVLDVAYADLDPALHGIGIHRASLFDALFAALSTEPGIAVVTDVAIAGCERGEGRRPMLQDDAGRKHGRYDLVIDASGARSRLRAANGDPPASPYVYGALWTALPLAGHAFDRAALAQVYRRASRMIGVMPLGHAPGIDGPAAAVFWSLRADAVPAWKKGGLNAWKDEVATIWPEAGALVAGISNPEELSPASYWQYTANRPCGDRLAAIGDAAHCTSPQLGQGANMGLLDAAVLANAIAASTDLGVALAAYAAARRRHVRFYQWASRWFTPLFQSDSVAGAWLRDAAMPAARLLPWSRKEIVRTLAGLKTGIFGAMDHRPLLDPVPSFHRIVTET